MPARKDLETLGKEMTREGMSLKSWLQRCVLKNIRKAHQSRAFEPGAISQVSLMFVRMTHIMVSNVWTNQHIAARSYTHSVLLVYLKAK